MKDRTFYSLLVVGAWMVMELGLSMGGEMSGCLVAAGRLIGAMVLLGETWMLLGESR